MCLPGNRPSPRGKIRRSFAHRGAKPRKRMTCPSPDAPAARSKGPSPFAPRPKRGPTPGGRLSWPRTNFLAPCPKSPPQAPSPFCWTQEALPTVKRRPPLLSTKGWGKTFPPLFGGARLLLGFERRGPFTAPRARIFLPPETECPHRKLIGPPRRKNPLPPRSLHPNSRPKRPRANGRRVCAPKGDHLNRANPLAKARCDASFSHGFSPKTVHSATTKSRVATGSAPRRGPSNPTFWQRKPARKNHSRWPNALKSPTKRLPPGPAHGP